jgi:glycosyltransferase involved in cell wall biosynthesis
VLLEAMQHGLACISTNEGAISQIIDDGDTGFIIESRNPSMLADKLQLLIQKPERCRKMGLRGNLKFRENYTIEHFEQRFIGILNSLL